MWSYKGGGGKDKKSHIREEGEKTREVLRSVASMFSTLPDEFAGGAAFKAL